MARGFRKAPKTHQLASYGIDRVKSPSAFAYIPTHTDYVNIILSSSEDMIKRTNKAPTLTLNQWKSMNSIFENHKNYIDKYLDLLLRLKQLNELREIQYHIWTQELIDAEASEEDIKKALGDYYTILSELDKLNFEAKVNVFSDFIITYSPFVFLDYLNLFSPNDYTKLVNEVVKRALSNITFITAMAFLIKQERDFWGEEYEEIASTLIRLLLGFYNIFDILKSIAQLSDNPFELTKEVDKYKRFHIKYLQKTKSKFPLILPIEPGSLNEFYLDVFYNMVIPSFDVDRQVEAFKTIEKLNPKKVPEDNYTINLLKLFMYVSPYVEDIVLFKQIRDKYPKSLPAMFIMSFLVDGARDHYPFTDNHTYYFSSMASTLLFGGIYEGYYLIKDYYSKLYPDKSEHKIESMIKEEILDYIVKFISIAPTIVRTIRDAREGLQNDLKIFLNQREILPTIGRLLTHLYILTNDSDYINISKAFKKYGLTLSSHSLDKITNAIAETLSEELTEELTTQILKQIRPRKYAKE